MQHIAWRRLRHWLRTHARTLRLAASYLLIIMVMSLGFSYVFYHTSAHELDRQMPPNRLLAPAPDGGYGYREFFQERADEGRNHLLDRLILVNIITLLLGSVLSYLLARHTLEPIEEAMTAQARFASDASHELRTPLASIQTENEVALRNSKLTLGRAKELLSSNVEEVIRLRQLADGLLQLARGHEAGLSLAPVNLEEVITEAVAGVQKAADQKRIVLQKEVPAVLVVSNAGALTQTFKILLDNAIKYSDAGTTVALQAVTSGREVLVSVKDQGVGISAEDLPRIFDRFYRADPSRSKQNVEGNGLGLALAAALITQLSGRLSAASTPGEGSTFIVHLPASKTT